VGDLLIEVLFGMSMKEKRGRIPFSLLAELRKELKD